MCRMILWKLKPGPWTTDNGFAWAIAWRVLKGCVSSRMETESCFSDPSWKFLPRRHGCSKTKKRLSPCKKASRTLLKERSPSLFEVFLTDHAKDQLNHLRRNRGLDKRYKAVRETIQNLARNPRHPSLQTREFTSLHGPGQEKVFEAYAEQSTPAAYRIFWYYGPQRNQITVISIESHP